MPIINIPEVGRVRFRDDLEPDELNAQAARVYDVNVRIPRLKKDITTNLQEAQNRTIEAGAYKVGEYAARAVDIFGTINWLGDIAAGFATDLIQGRALPSPSRGAMPRLTSTGAAIVQQPDTVTPNAKLTPVQEGIVEAARGAPPVVAGMAAQAVGVPAPLAFGTTMFGTTLQRTGDPVEAGKSGVVGAVIPGAGAVARQKAGQAVASAVNRGIISADNVAAQKVIESAAEFAGITAFMEALNLPSYMSMSPGERSDAMAKSFASQLAWLPMALMGLRGGRPSETQLALRGEPQIPTYTPEAPPPPAPLDPSLAPITIPVEPIAPPGGPMLGQIGMALREQSAAEQARRAAVKQAQDVPAPAKREAQLGEPTIIGQRPVTIVQDLIVPERFMESEAQRDTLVAERDRLTNAFSVAARNGDMRGMTDASRAIEQVNRQLGENQTAREAFEVDLRSQLEGTYPPTAEQLGTFQSRAVVPELSEVTKRPEPGRLPAAVQPESTRMGTGVEPVAGKVYPEPPVGVVPPETLRSEFVPQADIPEYPPARPPARAPEGEQRSGLISGSDLERWADKVIFEDPRRKTRGTLGGFEPNDFRRVAALAVKGAAIIERGIRDFAAWSSEMIKQFGEGIQPHLQDLYSRSQAYLEQKQSREKPAEPTPSVAAVGEPAPAAAPAKPEIARKPPRESTHKNPLGDTMGTTYYGTPEDVARYKELQAKFGELIKQGKDLSSPEVAPVLKENEAIKNKYGGMPPAERPAGAPTPAPAPAQAEDRPISQSPGKKAPKAAKPAGSEKARERDKPMYTDDRSKQELNKAGLEVVKSEEGKAKYTPAVMAKNGDLFTGATHDEALSNMDAAGKELASRNSVGYVAKDNPNHFLNLEGIAKEERRLEQQRKAGETDAIHETAGEVLRPVQEPPGESARKVPAAERPQQNAPPPQGGPPAGPPSGGAARPVEPPTQPPRGGGPSETQTTQGQEVLEPFQKPKRPLGEIYSEPFAERIRRLGGPVADRVARDTQRIVDHAKRLYGDLSANILDQAKRMSGRAFRGGTTWINGKTNINPRAAVGRMFTVLETYNQTGNWNHVPAFARPLAQVLYDANLAIGNLRNSGANPIGQAYDVMRLVTPWGVDVIRRGAGRAWNALVDGYAQANGQTRAYTEQFFRDWKAALDQPVPSATTLDQISKDFVANFPNAVTHLRPILGWHEFLQAAPFHYLEQSGQRVANTVAFQQVYPPGSGALNRTRADIQAEIRTDSGMAEFDNMTRALRGYPTDVAANWYNAPDTLVGALSRTAGMVLRPLKSGLLTQSLSTNVGETLAGGVGIFLGYGRLLRSLYQNGRLRAQMIRSGQINRAIRDFSFDPTKPIQSISKYASNLISRGFLNDFMNEVQEFSAASAARTVANEIRNGTLPANDVRLVQNTMRMMGFTKQQAIDAVAGRNPDVVNQFETKAAEALTSGNQILAEKSRLGSSRTFNQLFWFQSYPMLKFRQARSILNNVIEDAHQGDWRGAASNAALMGKFMVGTAMSGAITSGLLATLKEGLYGAGIRKQEAQDDFGKFVLNSFLMGMGGPLSTFSKVMEESGSIPQFRSNVEQAALESIGPYGLYKQIERAGAGTGEYEGLDTFERVGKFLDSKVPGLKPFKAAMAASGLSQDNAKLDSAISAYYRWARREIGIDKTEIQRKNDDRKDVRAYAKRVVNAVRDGKDFGEDLVKSIVAAAGTKTDNPYDSAARSIRGKQVIGGRLSPDEEAALRKHIGDDPVNRIKAHDMMLDKIADHVAGLRTRQ